jgi:CubicO group peptidase (beta-lactamase class C family)
MQTCCTAFGVIGLFLFTGMPGGAGGAPEPGKPRDIGALLEPIRRSHDLPALAGAIVTSEGIVAVGAVGVRKYGNSTPITVNDRFHLGSCTKSMTATLIAMLVEESKLSWDLTLARAFPELAGSMDPAYKNVTLEQLLAHRSGMTSESWVKGRTFLDMHRLPGTPRQQRAEYAAMILREPPAYEPGSKSQYSNRNYSIAGVMAERAANDSWENLMTRRLFRPLGMKTAGFGAMGTPGKVDQPWQHRLEGDKHIPIGPGPLSDNPPVIGPGGIVHCSIGDWAKYVAEHLRGEKGRSKLLKQETWRRLHSSPFGGDYGYGWMATEREWGGGRVLTHNGSNNQNYAVVWMAPKRDFAVLAATNQGGTAAEKACDEAAGAMIRDFLKRLPAK